MVPGPHALRRGPRHASDAAWQTMPGLTLRAVNEGVVAVHLANGEPVGHLKRIGGVWKFKAMGYEDGSLVPGGGPLTHRHNQSFATLDEAPIGAILLGP